MASLVLTLKTDETQARLQQDFQIDTGKPKEAALALAEHFKKVAGGITRASIDVQTGSADPVAASGTFTLASVVEDDAITIGTVTLTAKDSPSGENQFQTGGEDDTADAVVVAAAINDHSTLSQIVTATSAAAVVTVTSKIKGVIGNQLAISETGDTITASGSFLSGGTGGSTDAASTYSLGI